MSLVEFVRSEQRWFGGGSRSRRTAPTSSIRACWPGPLLADALVELRYGGGNHDYYQLLLGDDEFD